MFINLKRQIALVMLCEIVALIVLAPTFLSYTLASQEYDANNQQSDTFTARTASFLNFEKLFPVTSIPSEEFFLIRLVLLTAFIILALDHICLARLYNSYSRAPPMRLTLAYC